MRHSMWRTPPKREDAEGQFNFAEMHYVRSHVSESYEEIWASHQAVKGWEIAAELGYAPAQHRLVGVPAVKVMGCFKMILSPYAGGIRQQNKAAPPRNINSGALTLMVKASSRIL